MESELDGKGCRGPLRHLINTGNVLSPYSHSIVNGSCKPLSHRELLSPSRNFTVRFTVILTGTAENSFHHLSTSIEDDRRSCMSDLSRCIEIYRVQQHTMIGVNDALPSFAMAPDMHRDQTT